MSTRFERFIVCLICFFFLCPIIYSLLMLTPLFKDDSDPAPWGWPSQLIPRTDHLTGCQYLETARGAITPRLDRNGKQICKAVSHE